MAYYVNDINDDEVIDSHVDPEQKKGLPADARIITCIDCGFHFYLRKEECDYFRSKGFELPKRCKVCRQKRKVVSRTLSAIGSTKKCVDCGAEFEITSTELDFYSKNGLKIPKRCPECRKRRREQNETAKQQEQ